MPLERRPIRVLPRELAEKIAAGEVVERPASVVKELVENSIDAGAKNIRVDIEEGGRKRISVRDDGYGIADAEVLVALERHATSKIQELDDLWNVRTMGFRGEALPSIAAVSRMTIETLAADQHGRTVYLEGSRLIKDTPLDGRLTGAALSPQSGTTGTCISVDDLFFNVPARLKFLRSKSGESAQIRELIERIALTHPETGFSFYSDGRRSAHFAPASDETARVAAVLDTSADNIESFESQFENIHVKGWLDRDTRASNSRYIYLSVNRRMVRDKLLQQAVLVALRPRMMEGEYPRVYLIVEIEPTDVDVNVHPAKSEVRFRKSRDVFQVVHGALDRLAKTPARPYYSAPEVVHAKTQIAEEPSAKHSSTIPATETVLKQPTTSTPRLFSEDRVSYRTKIDLPIPARTVQPPEPAPAEEQTSERATAPGFSRLHYIGQLKNTYLLFQDGDGLVVVDQHAGHERVNYEKIKDRFLSNGLTPQPVLVSIVIKCHADEIELAQEHAAAFTKLGFDFEPFGESSLVLRAIPEGVEPARASELFRALLSEIAASEEGDLMATDPARLSPKLERVLATAACHSSVRAGQPLSPREALALAREMDATASSLNCPHGRPASIRLTFNQIEGLFKRG